MKSSSQDYPISEIPRVAWEEVMTWFFNYATSVEPYPPEEKTKVFKEKIVQLCSNDWNRGDIYAVIEECIEKNKGKMSEFQFDVLGEYLTALAGHCAIDYIERLPSDPPDVDIIDYARGIDWRKSAPKLTEENQTEQGGSGNPDKPDPRP